ncbi:hypothetical protein PABG_02066 [Paracoccidioides brasiliensis Pb03]|nr:hypothetical protein PABG_02066 [Paracoccidioides brasiliensis Pb03]
MSKAEDKPLVTQAVDDDEPDEWDKRIFSTGCAAEQLKVNDCYFEKKDWRACKKEPFVEPVTAYRSILHMEAFRECWKRHGNEQRTESKDAS